METWEVRGKKVVNFRKGCNPQKLKKTVRKRGSEGREGKEEPGGGSFSNPGTFGRLRQADHLRSEFSRPAMANMMKPHLLKYKN